MDYWLGVLFDQISTVVEKAMASEGTSEGVHLPSDVHSAWEHALSGSSTHNDTWMWIETGGLTDHHNAGPGARRRAAAFGRAFGAHVTKLRAEPLAYGELGLADLFEMREECLREFGFADVYRRDESLPSFFPSYGPCL